MSKEERILVIVESPNKIKTLRSILPKNYVVMASVGHIMEIAHGGVYNMGIDPEHNFKANFQISSDKQEVVNKLKDQVQFADRVILATDADREGEAIAWSLKEFLNIPNSKYERATFQEITKKAVIKAMSNTRKLDDDLVNAAQSRMKLDKMVGFMLSPVARKKIKAPSVGRVQSAGLKLIVDREKEIQNFIVETYYNLFLFFNKKNTEFKAKYFGTETGGAVDRFTSLEDVKAVVNSLKTTNKYIVSSVENKIRYSHPRPPFITSTFQQEVSSKLGIGVKDAMRYAQSLFEGVAINGKTVALITYHRTDSTELSDDFVKELTAHVKGNYGNKYYSPIRKGKTTDNAQEAHEAIRPTDLTITPQVLAQQTKDTNLVKVYDIIYQRTLAASMASAEYSETLYEIQNGEHIFKLSSKEMVFEGYKAVYGSFEEDSDENLRETLKQGEIISKHSLEAEEMQTRPPSRFKEATFIKELERRGIGRPSTFASTVETILSTKRGYCIVDNKNLTPTSRGMALIDFLDKSFSDVISIEYTSEMENEMDLIAKGKLNHNKFLKTLYTNLETAIHRVDPDQALQKETIDHPCPECGKPLAYRNSRFGTFIGCTGYPQCRYTEKINKK